MAAKGFEKFSAMSMRSLTGAAVQAVMAACLVAVTASNALAEDLPAASVAAAAAEDGGALFNPFAGTSPPPVRARALDPAPEGDWALPLLAATAGFAGIAVLMRKMID